MNNNHPLHEFFNLQTVSCSNLSPSNDIHLKSTIFDSDRCHKIRFCEFGVKNKFYAESLVIYPNFCYETPIFGTEYINFGSKKYFAAIDFHPITESNSYLSYMDMFPDKKPIKSKFYDLSKFFSEKLWVRKKSHDFYNEYQIMLKCFLYQYKKCLYAEKEKVVSFEKNHAEYNFHMKNKDPALGILKSYFGENFAKEYIDDFLFSNK